ncbi:hypothetical protein L3049_00210 [Labilibaculum sp. DW002]|uniref:DUF4468 domain-containing protein n=1 Tax=Paralabilibaculum antarcticum TaxID=2912572 RepID=A0ABT5VLU7_9BACT|nr:hypothetical protein [Labilibaculum sp. DW002]MDE5416408.1 hypothetical protein [Labilibaculum sp. DW002]
MKFINLPKLDESRSNFRNLKAIMGIGLLMLLLCQTSFGQKNTAFKTNSMSVFDGNIVKDPSLLKLRRKTSQIGSYYLNEDWKRADIYMVVDSSIVRGLETRIDLRTSELEIKYKGEIKVLPSFRVRSVVFTKDKSLFVTETLLKSNNKGFYEVLVDDENTLLRKYDTKLMSPSYNVQLDAGSKSSKVVKEQSYFVFNDLGIVKLAKTKNKLKKQLNKQKEVFNFIDENKINPKKETNLISLVNFLNKNHLMMN